MKKIVGFFLSMYLVSALHVLGQEADSTREASVYNFLILGTEFQPVSSFLARDFGQSLPWMSLRANFITHSGFYISTSAIHFFEPDLGGMFGGGIGYAKSLSQKMDLDIGYWYYGGGSYINSEGQDQVQVIQTSLGFDWKILYSSFQFQALINQPSDWLMITQHSRYFQLDQPVFGRGQFSFEPKAILSWGTANFYQLGEYSLTSEETRTISEFRLRAFEFSLPLTLTFGNFDFTVETTYIHPINQPEYDVSSSRIFAGGAITYSLPILKTKR